ncbi:MAG: TIGR04211 family SH3 domain-containing protein [Gammaproteobacteria bacterium]|nr:TIGR04211 family SH3 domain-containing protein [Gammaproteobacteria bacterium]
MRSTLFLVLFSLLLAAAAQAQNVRYVSDKQFIPLRSGAGSDYRIIHRGIPSGTRLTIARTSGDGEWAEITTEKGTTGWIRTQYLMQDLPAQNRVDAAEKRAAEAVAKSAALSEELAALRAQSTELEGQLNSSGSELGSVTEELAQLKQISGNAIQLDIDNRRLVEESENLRSDVEMLESENQRLQDKLESEDFLNGALAVLLGVIITLVVPRLWPKRRKSSSWA